MDAGTVAVPQSASSNKSNADKQTADFSALLTPNVNAANLTNSKTQTINQTWTNGTQVYDRYQYKDNSVEQASVPTMSDKIDSSQEALSDFEEEAVAVVSESLNVDEDQVKEVLEELGMTAFDLLNPQNLTAVVQELTGTADSTELLLNTDFEELLGNIEDLGSNLMEQLDLQPEQMDELISQLDQMAAAQETESATDVVQESDALLQESAVTDIAAETQSDKMTEISVSDPQQNKTIRTDAKETDDKNLANRVSAEEGETKPQDEQVRVETEASDGRNDSRGTKEQTSPGADQGAGLNNGTAELTQSTTVEAPVAETEAPLSYTSVDALDLIEQVAENVKVVLANDSTSMEMQLNPENLGKIYLNVSTKEGMVNAQIAAQNEAVKEALETQIATLRENLNQAGVKVDAIEVTVASHEFEKNLEQNEHRGEQQQAEEASAQPSARRSIRMDSLDELSGLMTEEEILAAQIMKDNGNSVDLTA
jgi:flagellar hook-length control protein FliK